jgi:hypothetical protein
LGKNDSNLKEPGFGKDTPMMQFESQEALHPAGSMRGPAT